MKTASNNSPAKLTIVTTRRVVKDLEHLAGLGYFGRTTEEVAEELLRRAVRELVGVCL